MDLQQASPSPVCPSDDVILTCTVTAPTNEADIFLYFYNAFNEEDRVFYDAGETSIANNSTVGPFTTKTVEISNSSIVATATINGITFQDATCAGIICKDGSGDEKVIYIAIGTKKSRRYKLIISLQCMY